MLWYACVSGFVLSACGLGFEVFFVFMRERVCVCVFSWEGSEGIGKVCLMS